ncbi:hypothetical protein HDE_01655 [Halotydeus destructor]|nr:hypothetical protein HDE_01655 [Halotydeus destructor]
MAKTMATMTISQAKTTEMTKAAIQVTMGSQVARMTIIRAKNLSHLIDSDHLTIMILIRVSPMRLPNSSPGNRGVNNRARDAKLVKGRIDNNRAQLVREANRRIDKPASHKTKPVKLSLDKQVNNKTSHVKEAKPSPVNKRVNSKLVKGVKLSLDNKLVNSKLVKGVKISLDNKLVSSKLVNGVKRSQDNKPASSKLAKVVKLNPDNKLVSSKTKRVKCNLDSKPAKHAKLKVLRELASKHNGRRIEMVAKDSLQPELSRMALNVNRRLVNSVIQDRGQQQLNLGIKMVANSSRFSS